MEIKFIITNEFEGQRLDSVVASNVAGYSRSQITQMIKDGDILVSGIRKKPSFKVQNGELITGVLYDLDKRDKLIELDENNLKLNIIYEDPHLLVINKNPGIVVHPAPGNCTGTLVNAIINYYPQIKAIGGDEEENDSQSLRPGIVHRLDKDTSGVIVVAKDRLSFLFLKKEFAQRRVEKRYIALVSGNMDSDSGRIALPISRHPVKRKMMSTILENGRHAETIWRVQQRFSNATLVEIELKTGRTHQIRVHFKAIGHPLVGDVVYGFKKGGICLENIKKNNSSCCKYKIKPARQMLHAWKLGFRHPWSGRRVEFIAPLPEDMTEFIKLL